MFSRRRARSSAGLRGRPRTADAVEAVHGQRPPGEDAVRQSDHILREVLAVRPPKQVAQVVPVKVKILIQRAVHVEEDDHRSLRKPHPLIPPDATPLMIFLRRKMKRRIIGSTTTVAAAISFS